LLSLQMTEPIPLVFNYYTWDDKKIKFLFGSLFSNMVNAPVTRDNPQ
jgi:hypothetical protein